jgi:hypothetical protein
MYQETEAQKAAEAKLRKQGFRFSNWIPAEPNGDGQPVAGSEHLGTMVMKRKPNRFTTEYREIEPDGSVH